MLGRLSLLVLISCFSFTTQATQLQFPYVPDSSVTTGGFCDRQDPDYLGEAYPERIPKCERDVIVPTKQKIYKLYSVRSECQKNYTIDHFIPLSLGGNNQNENLWPEHKSIKALRQNLELDLFQKLRDGKITQVEAVRQIRHAKLNPPITKPMSLCR